MSAGKDTETGTGSLAELFHLVGSLVPKGHHVVVAPPDMTVAEAIQIMNERNFSQIPVMAGNTVLGVFSLRSLASQLMKMTKAPEHFRDLPVDEFVEQFQFVQPSDNWESILKHLNQHDGVLVGNRNELEGIVTAMDVLGYLYGIANPFVMLAEIELSLRRIIQSCVTADELRRCIHTSLSSKYAEGETPTDLSEMTFNDYVQIVEHSRNWPHFTVAFGQGEWQRKATAQRLKEVRDLRNDVFHFRRPLVSTDHETLATHRAWLQMKARAFEARQAEKAKPSPEVEKAPRNKTRQGRQWDEPSFLTELERRRGTEDVQVAQKILDWAKSKELIVRWGKGQKEGTCSLALVSKPASSPFGMVTAGRADIHFSYMRKFPPFDDEQKRMEWLHRLNEIPGVDIADRMATTFPTIQLNTLADEAAFSQFLETMDWVIQEIRNDPQLLDWARS